ncbi:MAG TPA: aspartyl/asparaginyl beta-hydroxylase domain-containing protein [Acetobacteraceae bacterium]|nr:aspartyl/asparaginyl beta-hydroxylase domain-containing protein [Acetobacteraceae bacterium]
MPVSLSTDPGGGTLSDAATEYPWQRRTVGSGLMLHAPACEPLHLPRLWQEFARADVALGPAGRTYLANDGTWSGIALVERSGAMADGTMLLGVPTPALADMPLVQTLLSSQAWHVISVYLPRQPPRGTLPWHFDNQALHLSECRLLLPICAPTDAVTWIGHDAAAHPQGTLWTGDFGFPHQVDNPAATQHVVLAIDVRSDPVVRRLLPAPLTTDPGQRRGLAQAAQNLLLQWRARPRQQEPADAHP